MSEASFAGFCERLKRFLVTVYDKPDRRLCRLAPGDRDTASNVNAREAHRGAWLQRHPRYGYTGGH